MPYTAPMFKREAFNCPYCNAFSHTHWYKLYTQGGGFTRAWLGQCVHCKEKTLWWTTDERPECGFAKMLVPLASGVPQPHPDMPAAVAQDYEEARAVAAASPRAACALLRVAIERLCAALEADGDNINAQIGYLVKQGLPVQVQQALDAVRVIGNNAVHPGKMDPSDVADVSDSLFALVNFIVEDRITRPKMVADVFAALPEGARKAIQKRDA